MPAFDKSYNCKIDDKYFSRPCWDTSTLSKVLNCDGVVLEIYLDHKFQWPEEGLKCRSLAYEIVT